MAARCKRNIRNVRFTLRTANAILPLIVTILFFAMPQQKSHIFEPLEMNDIRKRAGTVFETVSSKHKRFIVRKSGKPRALIVPLTDQPHIEQAVSEGELDKMYAAFEEMDGMVKDEATDTSEQVDEILYGQAYDEAQQRSK